MNLVFCLLAEETLALEQAVLADEDALERAMRMPLVWAVVLGALGLSLMLPQGGRRRRWLGMVLGFVALGMFGYYGLSLGGWVEDLVFFVLATVTVISATATITSRSPVYSAIWFAMVLLGTAGLFLYQGAQFLGVATVVVYAGAILVTFLFVLMLAQPDGEAYYDRMSWQPLLSAVAGSVLIGLMTGAILQTTNTPLTAKLPKFVAKWVDTDEKAAGDTDEAVSEPAPESESETPAETPAAGTLETLNAAIKDSLAPPKEKLAEASPRLSGADPAAMTAPGGVLNEEHVATLGQEMFSRRLIAVEVAGALLLAALVGAVAIVTQGKKLPQVDPHAQQHGSSAHV